MFNNMLYAVLVLIILVCLAIVLRLAGGKLRKLKLIAVEAIPAEKQGAIKKRLLEIRLQKRLISNGQKIFSFLKKAGTVYLNMAVGLVKLFQIKRQKSLFTRKMPAMNVKTALKTTGAVSDKLLEAGVLIKKRIFDEAEGKCLEALKDEPKNIDIFLVLGDIYMLKKEWASAEETYRHIMRIDPQFLLAQKELANILEIIKKWEELKQLSQYILKHGHEEAWVFVKLGLSYRKTGYPDVAEKYFERAVELEPKSEQALDYLLEAAIINKNKSLALKAFNTLAGISSDAMKMQSYKDKIAIL